MIERKAPSMGNRDSYLLTRLKEMYPLTRLHSYRGRIPPFHSFPQPSPLPEGERIHPIIDIFPRAYAQGYAQAAPLALINSEQPIVKK